MANKIDEGGIDEDEYIDELVVKIKYAKPGETNMDLLSEQSANAKSDRIQKRKTNRITSENVPTSP